MVNGVDRREEVSGWGAKGRLSYTLKQKSSHCVASYTNYNTERATVSHLLMQHTLHTSYSETRLLYGSFSFDNNPYGL